MKSATGPVAKLLAPALFAALFASPTFSADPTPPADEPSVISQTELLAKLAAKNSDVVILDVRTPAEFAAGHVPGARNVSHDDLPKRLDELTSLRNKPVVLYCRSGRRTQIAADTLRAAGFTQLLHLEGDYLAWEAEKRPVERSPSPPPESR